MRTVLASVAALLLLSCGGSAPPPAVPESATSPSAPAPKAEAKEDDAAKKAAALESLTAAEAKSGTCDDGHRAALEKVLASVEASMKTRTGEDGNALGMELVGKRVVALGPAPRSVEMSVTGRGTELHVLAYGARGVSMDVLVGAAAASTMRSPHQRGAASTVDIPGVGAVELESDSRQTEIKPGQPLVVRLSGEGCAAMITFLRK